MTVFEQPITKNGFSALKVCKENMQQGPYVGHKV